MTLGERTCSIAILVVLAAGVAAADNERQTLAAAPHAVARPTRLAELVSTQLQSGRQQGCPRDSMVFYEACLLYQGAFGFWRSVGFPERCGEDPVSTTDVAPQVLARRALEAVANPCFASVYSVAVTNAVPILTSTLNQYFPMILEGGFENPGTDAERCLQLRYGICGNHTALAQSLLEQAGLTVRPVQFFYEVKGVRYSHIAPEVLIAGKYRFLDTTYGAYWTTERRQDAFILASLEEIRSKGNPSRDAIWNAALVPYAVRRAVVKFDPFEYLTAANVDIIRDDQGTITLHLRGPSGVEKFANLPRFVGDNRNDGKSIGVDFAIKGARGRYEMTLRTLATAVTNDAPATVCIDDVCQNAPRGMVELTFNIKDPRRLHVASGADAAYVVMESLSWKRRN